MYAPECLLLALSELNHPHLARYLQNMFHIWQIVFCSLLLLLQLGFVLAESMDSSVVCCEEFVARCSHSVLFGAVGSVRSKHASSVILKNLADFCLSAVTFLAIGYAIAAARRPKYV